MIYWQRFAFALLLILFFSSCATYKPPRLPEEQMARLTPDPKNKSVAIRHVDGKSPSVWVSCGIIRYLWGVDVAPGPHRINVDYSRNSQHGRADVWFVAEAGRAYMIRAETHGYRFRTWIEDIETGRPVGGVHGSDDEARAFLRQIGNTPASGEKE